jgi:serine/threonine protein kinase
MKRRDHLGERLQTAVTQGAVIGDFGQYSPRFLLSRGIFWDDYVARLVVGKERSACSVCLRVLNHELSRKRAVADAFLDEGRFAVSLQHPGLCDTHSTGRSGDAVFVVRETPSGITLRRFVERSARQAKPLPWEVVAYVGAHLCDILTAIHERAAQETRATHGHLSTAEISIHYGGAIKLKDHGYATFKRQVADARWAPRADVRTDLRLVGQILGEMLSARALALPRYARPQPTGSLRETLRKDRAPGETSAVLEEIVCSLIAPELDQPFANAREVRNALISLIRSSQQPQSPRETLSGLVQLFQTKRPGAIIDEGIVR